MQIPKEQILELLRSRGQDDKASQADSELPDKVDTEQHAGILQSSASTRATLPARSAGSAASSGSETAAG